MAFSYQYKKLTLNDKLTIIALVVSIIVGISVIVVAYENLRLVEETNRISSLIYNSTNYDPVFINKNQKIMIDQSSTTTMMPGRGWVTIHNSNNYTLSFDYAGRSDLKLSFLNLNTTNSDLSKCSPLEKEFFVMASSSDEIFVPGNGYSRIDFPISMSVWYDLKEGMRELEKIENHSIDDENSMSSILNYDGRIGSATFQIQAENLNTKTNEIIDVHTSLHLPFSQNVKSQINQCEYKEFFSSEFERIAADVLLNKKQKEAIITKNLD